MKPEKFITESVILLSSTLEFSVQELLSLLLEKKIDPTEYKNVMIDNREFWDRDYNGEGFVVVHHKQIVNPNFEAEMEAFNRKNQEELERKAEQQKEKRLQEENIRARKVFKEFRRQQRIASKLLGRYV
jgi:hypothetical protein